MGAIFRVNIIEREDLLSTIKEIKKHKFKVMQNIKKTAIVIGNEANGVSKEILENSDKKIKIPMLR